MEKGVFEQNFDEMVELDSGLNINDILAASPALETEPPKKVDEPDKKVDQNPLKDINKVLELQTADSKEDKTDSVAKVDNDLDDKTTPAPLDTTTKVDDTSDASFTVIFARDLVEQGLLSSFDEESFVKSSKELGDANALRALIKDEITANIEAAKSDLDAGYQEYLIMIGKGVPVDTAGNLVELKTRFDNIKPDDLTKDENTELRKQVMIDYFKLTTSMPDAKIEKLVQNSIDMGDDIEDSKEYHSTIKTLVSNQIKAEEQEAVKQQKLAEEENRRSIDALKDNINSVGEIIPGVAINKQTKVQMFEAITKPVQDSKGRTTNALWAKRADDPMFFDQRLAYLFATGFFEKDKPWTKASQAKVTADINKLETALKDRNNTESRTGSPVLRSPVLDKTSKDNIDSMRGVFNK